MSEKVKLRAIARTVDAFGLAIGVDDQLYRYRCGRWEFFPCSSPAQTFEIVERIYPAAVTKTSRTIEVAQ